MMMFMILEIRITIVRLLICTVFWLVFGLGSDEKFHVTLVKLKMEPNIEMNKRKSQIHCVTYCAVN